jgi:hypothetical protein
VAEIRNPFTKAVLRLDEKLESIETQASKQPFEPFMMQQVSARDHRARLNRMTPEGFQTHWSEQSPQDKQGIHDMMGQTPQERNRALIDLIRGGSDEPTV